jgi:hypothetical protein
LKAVATVLPNQLNHLELVIGDGTDGVVDSFVLVQGSSVSTTPVIPNAPAAPAALALAAGSDSGIPGDNITNVTLPTITGTGESGDTVTLLDGATVIGTGTVQSDGTWAVTAATALTEGANALTATETNAAGNISAASAALSVILDTTVPGTPGIPAPGQGAEQVVLETGNEITNDAAPSIAGTALPGSTVTLFSNGVAVGSAIADATTGVFAVAPGSPLALGLDVLTVTASIGAADSATSAPIQVFDLQAPVGGISTTDLSSADLGAALDQGARFAFVNGTEAVLLADGTLSVGPDTNEATLQRLYEGLLGRSSDTGGISYYDAQLAAGVDKATVANAFLAGSEYVAAHGTPSDAQFVASLYQGLLGRAADADGSAAWTGALAQGASRGDVAVAIADGAEAKAWLAPATARLWVPDAAGTLAHELFETGLGREVERAALPAFSTAFATLTPAELAAGIAGSAEFAAVHGGQSDADYVGSLYQAGLGRAADQAGAAYWTGALAGGGASRSDVLLAIATSGDAASHLTRNLGG